MLRWEGLHAPTKNVRHTAGEPAGDAAPSPRSRETRRGRRVSTCHRCPRRGTESAPYLVVALALIVLTAFPLAASAAEKFPPPNRLGLHFEAIVVSFENDKFFAGSDRHYTQGGRLTFLYNADAKSPLTRAARRVLSEAAKLLGDERLDRTRPIGADDTPEIARDPEAFAALAVSLGQDMFTPTDTESPGL
ncbi:MAG: hypothetical protein C0502_12215, partial [Opitutus sp.]|nr:hypothetical protein [Opitutus sp.]